MEGKSTDSLKEKRISSWKERERLTDKKKDHCLYFYNYSLPALEKKITTVLPVLSYIDHQIGE